MSITNKIIANIKKVNIDENNYINSENVICIDTSFNRIGINTKNPAYAIDISGENTIKSYNLKILNLGDISEISSNKITCTDISFINLDASNGIILECSFNKIYSNFIETNDISINYIFVPVLKANDVSCSNLDVSNTATINILKANTIEVSNILIPETQITTTNIQTGNISTISNEFLTTNEISCNKIYVQDNAYFFNDTSFNNMDVSGDASFSTIYSDKITCNNLICNDEISSNSITTGGISASSINADTITSNGESIIQSGALNIPGTAVSVFNHLTVSNILTVNNLIDTSNINVKEIIDLSNANKGLILTKYFDDKSTLEQSGNLVYDYSNDILKVYNNNNWNNVFSKQKYATFELNNSSSEISGNDINFNSVFNSYFISDASNLLLTDNKYKYIPLKFKSINSTSLHSTVFDICNNYKTIKIQDLSGIYEINANISLQYLNNFPGDVDPNAYDFGIYSDTESANLLNDLYINTKNTIITFDNSYNFANSSLNYIGPIINNTTGFNFYINSNKDINYIAINKFSGTIKQLNN